MDSHPRFNNPTSPGRKKVLARPLLAAILLAVLVQMSCSKPEGKESDSTAESAVKMDAPEFPKGLEWFNTDHPLTLKELRGKIVVLDFWTYCCINCMHIIPDLKRIEKKYGDSVVVIGVHSGKYDAERIGDNIRQAILRYDLEHPVVNDAKMQIWDAYHVRAWPTVYVIDPQGKVVGHVSGEGVYGPLDSIIPKLIAEFQPKGLLDEKPIHFALEKDKQPKSLLSFPGKVLVDAKSGKLYVADSGHNRIVVADLKTGDVETIIGSGKEGMDNGPFDKATFHHPHGLALDGTTLYVADTENHAIRAADFATSTVRTVAGTGQQASYPLEGGPAATTALSSPWALTMNDGNLYIAMAGCHQLWVLDIKKNHVEPYAGTSREGRMDGRLDTCSLAQPSGITTDGHRLYFADSEDSSIRSADLPPGNDVKTLVGRGLFVFGDQDGVGSDVRLQHPLGVAYYDGFLYVADTYNNKIKRLDPKTRRCETLFGDGTAGFRDGKGTQARFNEPGGLFAADGKLYIADTNNHLIRVADLKTDLVTSFMFHDMAKLTEGMAEPASREKRRELPLQTVSPDTKSVTLSIGLPAGRQLNAEAPSRVRVVSSQKGVAAFDGNLSSATVTPRSLPIRIPISLKPGQTTLDLDLAIYSCDHGANALCYFSEGALALPLHVEPKATSKSIEVKWDVK